MNFIKAILFFASIVGVACTGLCFDTENSMGSLNKEILTNDSLFAGTYSGSESGLFRVCENHKSYTLERVKYANCNPSFGVTDKSQEHFYCVDEGLEGKIVSYHISSDMSLERLNTASSHGSYPCYVSLSPDESMIAVANYGSGTVAIYSIDKQSGEIGGLIHVIRHEGHSVNQSRQEGPHAHFVKWSLDGLHLYVVDLGIDKVMRYEKSENWETGYVALKLTPGSGPRHMVFKKDSDLCYIVNELSNTVVAAHVLESGDLEPFQEISTLPEGYREHSQAGHIALSPNGKYLYVSNRGHNSIVVYEIQGIGRLKDIQTAMLKGDWPRFFCFTSDGKGLLVANQNSNSLELFQIDEDGLVAEEGEQLSFSGRSLKQPVFLQFVK